MLATIVLLAAAAAIDWKAVEQETLRHYQTLVRFDTTNPPGNEIRAVEYLKQVLEREGIPVKTFAKDPKRPNLVARLKGSGAKKPLLMMGHTDTVTVDASKWTDHGAFSADRADGHIYGRGTLDDKDNVTASLMTMLLLKRSGVTLDRDVIFLAEAAEEASALTYGVGFMADEHFDEIDAEYCLAELGTLRRQNGKPIAMLIGTAEKLPRGVQLVAHGTAGHGSRPAPNNAVLLLANAISALGAWQPPVRLNATTREYFERLASISTPEEAARYSGLFDPAKATATQAWFKQNDPTHYSTVTTTVVPTVLKAGRQSNVIPSEAEATLDIRMLPDEDAQAFYAEMKKVINNPAVEIVTRGGPIRPPAPPSRLDSEMFKALEAVQQRMYPGIKTLPSMGTGASDMSVLRTKGINCYGIGPGIDIEDTGAGYGSHSDKERILEQSLYDFVRFNYDVVSEVAAHR